MLLLIASTVPLAVGGGGEGVAGAAVRGPEESAAFKPDPAVHIFFYAWFGNPSHPWGLAEHNRGNWREWNQEVQAHWDVKEAAKYTSGKLMNPPEDAATAFFPERGLYSSIDPNVAAAQMQEIAGAGAGVVVFSWWRDRSVEPCASDGRGNGPSGPIGTDRASLIALDAAAAAGVRVCFHLEPYDGRDHAAFQEDVAYLLDTYGTHEAFYRDASGRPLWYVYDSYRQPAQFWATLLTAGGARTLRGTRLDGVFIGLYLTRGHERYAEVGGFDGLYTYFAATAFSDGTRTSEWPRLATWAQQRGKLFVPCVGPGYDDSRLRPWNSVSWRYRAMGRYYQDMWADAIASEAPVIAVTSFNEWGEGTQIEPAASARSSAASGFKYQAYGPDPQLYLRLTATAVADWAAARLSRGAHARSVPALPLPTRPAAPTRPAQSVPCPAAQRLSGGSARLLRWWQRRLSGARGAPRGVAGTRLRALARRAGGERRTLRLVRCATRPRRLTTGSAVRRAAAARHRTWLTKRRYLSPRASRVPSALRRGMRARRTTAGASMRAARHGAAGREARHKWGSCGRRCGVCARSWRLWSVPRRASVKGRLTVGWEAGRLERGDSARGGGGGTRAQAERSPS